MAEAKRGAKGPEKTQSAAETLENWIRRSVHQHNKKFYNRANTSYRLGTWIVLVAAGLALVAGPLWVGRPQYRHYKERRAVRLAEAFLAKGDARNAALRARQALLLNPANVTASVIMAQIATAAHSAEELTWRQRVAELEPTVDNKLLVAETGLHFQQPPFPITTQVINELATIGATNARYESIAARLAWGRRQAGEAESDFAAAARLDPTNAHYVLNLALFRLALTNEAQRAEARVRLRQLQDDPVYGVEALRGLAADRLRQNDYAGARTFSDEVATNAQVRLMDRFQNLEILQRIKSSDFTPRLADLQRLAGTNAPTVAAVSAWMLSHDLTADSLQWLKSQPAWLQAERPVVLALAAAYEANDQWQELSDFASHGNWGDGEFLRFAVVSHASTHLGRVEVARSNWGSAENEAAGHRDRLRKLLELASRWRLKVEQEVILARIVADFPEDQEAVKSLAQIYATDGNTGRLNQLFARLSPLFPTNTHYQGILTGTSLLLRTNLPQAIKAAGTAFALAPEDSRVASAYAYALHLSRHDDAGLAIFNKLAPAELAEPTPTLYYGVLLAAEGRVRDAAPWLDRAQSRTNVMLPEERQLLAQARARH